MGLDLVNARVSTEKIRFLQGERCYYKAFAAGNAAIIRLLQQKYGYYAPAGAISKAAVGHRASCDYMLGPESSRLLIFIGFTMVFHMHLCWSHDLW